MAKPKKTDMHVQCKFTKPGKIGTRITHSWIPEKYAHVGSYVQLKDRETKEWEDGWMVAETWGKKPSIDILANTEFHKTHRDGTDAYRDKNGNWVTRKEKANA